MAYSNDSQTLRQHREKLLEIALQHAQRGGLNSVKRAEIAAEAKCSTGTVSFALGSRSAMLDRVMQAAQQRGIQLSFAGV